MSWSAGVFTRTNGTYTGGSVWSSDAGAGTKILSSNHDTHDQDLADGINACLNKTGQNSVTGDMDWGNFKLTNLAAGVASTDAVRLSQLVTTFGGLSDTPANFSGSGLKVVRVNSGATALEFATLATVSTTGAYSDLSGAPTVPTSIGDMTDVDITGISDGKILKWVGANNRFEIGDDAGGTGGSTFASLTDTPTNYVGAALQSLRVNAAGDAVEFYTPTATDSFLGLSDSPGSYTSQALKTVRVNAGATALEFGVALATVASSGSYNDLSSKPSVPTLLNDLSNVTGTPSDNQVLRYDSGTSKWSPSTESTAGGTNITSSRTSTAYAINSNTGSDTSLLAASSTLCGVMTATDKTNLDAAVSTYATAITDGDFTSNGYMVRRASGTYSSRSIVAGNGMSVTYGDGNLGNTTVASAYTLSTSAPSGTPSSTGHVWYRY